MQPRANTREREPETAKRAVCKLIKTVKMKTIRMLLILVCTLISVGVSAQTISGKLIDEDSQPLPYANVVLLSLPDSVFVSGATSDDKGNFILKDLSSRSYLLQVSYIGYQPQSILLENLDRKINLGDIRLVQDAMALKGVTVTGSNVVEKNRQTDCHPFI